nr:hypothetical protein Iba_chr12fCG16820 [Ipomoea batatas]
MTVPREARELDPCTEQITYPRSTDRNIPRLECVFSMAFKTKKVSNWALSLSTTSSHDYTWILELMIPAKRDIPFRACHSLMHNSLRHGINELKGKYAKSDPFEVVRAAVEVAKLRAIKIGYVQDEPQKMSQASTPPLPSICNCFKITQSTLLAVCNPSDLETTEYMLKRSAEPQSHIILWLLTFGSVCSEYFCSSSELIPGAEHTQHNFEWLGKKLTDGHVLYVNIVTVA